MKVVFCTCPPADAERIARGLVERGAACVNVLPAVRSIYRWQGRVHDDAEALLVVKAADDAVDVLRASLKDLHPYELPEWVVLDAEAAHTSEAYARWVEARGG